MQKYQNVVERITQDGVKPVVGAFVAVQSFPGGVASTIYSDNGVTPASNPLITDDEGRFAFYAADGRYQLAVSGPLINTYTETDILLEDPVDPQTLTLAQQIALARAAGQFMVLEHNTTFVTAPADTNDNTLLTIAVPAAAMGINGILRITTLWLVTNNANAKTLRTRFGGTDYCGASAASVATVRHQVQINNIGAANSQQGLGASNSGLGGSTATVLTSAADTTTAQNLTIGCQKATAGDVITLRDTLVELLPT